MGIKTKDILLKHKIENDAWLNLPNGFDEDNIFNPLTQIPDSAQENPHLYIIWLMSQPEYFSFITKYVLNLDLTPMQLCILREIWNRKFPMFIASRGASKTFSMAVYCLLRLLFLPRRKIVVAGAAFRQSKFVFEYMETIWNNAPVLRDLVGHNGGPSRDIDMWRFRIFDSTAVFIPIGDGCLTSDTLITYEDKFAFINAGSNKDVEFRNKKIYGNFEFNTSDQLYHNGIKDTKIVTTKRGYKYEGTYNHKMRVMTKNGITWKRTDELEIGDYILIDRSERWHNGKTDIREDEAYACGLMVGDGNWTNKYRLGFASPDEELIPLLNQGLSVNFIQSKNDKIHFRVDGRDIRQSFLNRFELPKLYGHEKYIPDPIMRSERHVMSSFLRGLFDADGHVIYNSTVNKGNTVYVGLTTTSKRLAYEVQYILLHYGIICSLNYRDRKRKNKKCKRVYELLITGNNVELFAKYIGFTLQRKRDVLLQGLSSKKVKLELENIVPFAKDILYDFIDSNDSIKNSLRPHLKTRKNITFKYFKRCIQPYIDKNINVDNLLKLCNEDIFYDVVVDIKESRNDTFDLHVPIIHEYCANGFFSHNSTIRGLRANDIIVDEFASIDRAIFETVISGFGAVSSSPIENIKAVAARKRAIELGIWEEEVIDKKLLLRDNQVIIAGTAYYNFNHFAHYWNTWHKIIESKGDKAKIGVAFGGEDKYDPNISHHDFSIIRIPFAMIPEGFMDAAQVARSKATFDAGTFDMEYNCIFSKDSNGFFKRSLIESCVVNHKTDFNLMPKDAGLFSATLYGKQDMKYVFGIDPASEIDNFAIVILEVHSTHRRIVHCWTINRKGFKERVKNGLIKENDYYKYCCQKIRELKEKFPTEHIAIDTQGGGYAILEGLQAIDSENPNQIPLLPMINPDKPRDSDGQHGDHVIELVNFASADYTRDANHGLRKDFEDKVLLFPFFDSITLAEIELPTMAEGSVYDGLEDCVLDIEELKDELASIVVTETASGRQRWDTPEVKISGSKKERARKDRYSALVMANMLARSIKPRVEIGCTVGGGFASPYKMGGANDGPMYSGPSWFTQKMNGLY